MSDDDDVDVGPVADRGFELLSAWLEEGEGNSNGVLLLLISDIDAVTLITFGVLSLMAVTTFTLWLPLRCNPY